MANSSIEHLPEISILNDEGITLESIQSEMITDYEQRYKELTGQEISLHPADEERIKLMVVAGMYYQLCVIMNENYKMNFLPNMYGARLRNWAANFGFVEDGTKRAIVQLRFFVSEAQENAIGIPEGTRATAGDNIFFATDTYVEILPGETYVDVSATCTQDGKIGNGYREGQIAILADPVNKIREVSNITISDGGRDAYTDEELREKILNFPSTYSTAGPEEGYIQFVKQYSERIVSARKIEAEDAVVRMCIMCKDGEVPDEGYCGQVLQYVKSLKCTPDTDKIEIVAPEVVEYELHATFYISENKKDIAESIKTGVEEAAASFVQFTCENIGYDINPDILTAYVSAAGARRIIIDDPGYTVIRENQIAICKQIDVKYGGLELE